MYRPGCCIFALVWHYGGRSYEPYGDALLNEGQFVREFRSIRNHVSLEENSVVLFKAQEEGEGARCAPGAEETAQYGQGPLDLSATHKSHIYYISVADLADLAELQYILCPCKTVCTITVSSHESTS